MFDAIPKRRRWLPFILGAIAGGALASLAVRMVHYFRQLLGEPRLVSIAILSRLGVSETVEQRAARIALEDLKAGIELRSLPDGSRKLVLCAGRRNFREPWARDFGFASYGLLAARETRVTLETLEVFLHFQAADGQFPVKVHSTTLLNRYLHSLFRRVQPIALPLHPRYLTGHNSISLDGNGLLVIAALNYARQTGDESFLQRYWDKLRRAMHWLEKFAVESDALLQQGPFADWADSVARQGRVLYTNVIYWKALREMSAAAQEVGFLDERLAYEATAEKVRKSIQHFFWRPDLGYFVTNQVFDNLSSGGNLLAIAWGLADDAQAGLILEKMQAMHMDRPVPTRAASRPYPGRYIALENRLGGLAAYHTQAAWVWLGAWHVIALLRQGQTKQAQALFERLAAAVARDGEVLEVYGSNGHPLSSLWYLSESPLTWSAGMLFYAYSQLYPDQASSVLQQARSDGPENQVLADGARAG